MTGALPHTIMMTADTVGGVWTYAVSLARGLAARGNSVRLVTMGPLPSLEQRRMAAGCGRLTLTETDLKLEWQDPEGEDIARAAETLGAIARQTRPDVVHLNSYREARFEWHAPVVVAAHSCVNSWAAACEEQSAFVDSSWQAYTAAVEDGLRAADVWVAPTAAFRGAMHRHYRIDTPGEVIWNGSMPPNVRSAVKEPFILAAGRGSDQAKNLASVAEFAWRLRWPVRIAGSAGVAGCEDLGRLGHDALLAEMKRAAVFLSPARYEPFGLSVLEAASHGCALVLSDIPTFRELWDGAALFVPSHDTAELRHGLHSIMRDDLKRIRLQHAAHERSRHYTLDRTVGAYQRLYASLLRGAASRSARSADEVCA